MLKRIALIAALAGAYSAAHASFTYADFSSTNGLALNGTATQVSNFIRLTQDGVNGQAGNMWHVHQQGVALGFTTNFNLRSFGADNPGADGVAFSIQGSGTSLMGNGGGDNAMGGIANSVMVNFQTFWNRIQLVGFNSSGNVEFFTDVSANLLRQANGLGVSIGYNGVTKAWSVSTSMGETLNATYDLGNVVNLNSGSFAYVGLGSGTGAADDNNEITMWNMEAVPEPGTMIGLGLGASMLLRRRARK